MALPPWAILGLTGTWPFPVLYKVVKGASPQRVVTEKAQGLLPDFVAAAQELAALGADGITTNCGFSRSIKGSWRRPWRCLLRPRV